MRIHASTLGLAAYMIGAASTADSTSNTIILFGGGLPSPPVLESGRQLTWTKNSNVTVRQAWIRKKDDNNTVVARAARSGTDHYTKESASDTEARRREIAGPTEGGFILDSADLVSETGGSITLDYNGQKNDYVLYTAVLTPLYLQIDWFQADDLMGSSYSSLFAVSDGTTASAELNNALTEANGQSLYDPAYSECSSGYGCGQSTTSTPSAILPSVDSTSAPTSTVSPTVSSASSSNSNNASTGLSTGAIAGIAVACGLVGLALIGGAVWFLCFRRRRTSHAALGQSNGYASDGVGAIMADKEMPHATTDSPHSAYAADRSQLHDPHETARSSMVGAGAIGAGTGLISGGGRGGHGAAQGGDDAYAPYSDHTPPPPGVAARGLGSEGTGPMDSQTSLPTGGARSPTPPTSTRYAHLVEEGMTADEIRRLEEEERALDMAIEDAGRSSRAQ